MDSKLRAVLGIHVYLERGEWAITRRGRYWCTNRNAWVVTFYSATKYESNAAAVLDTNQPNFYSF